MAVMASDDKYEGDLHMVEVQHSRLECDAATYNYFFFHISCVKS